MIVDDHREKLENIIVKLIGNNSTLRTPARQKLREEAIKLLPEYKRPRR